MGAMAVRTLRGAVRSGLRMARHSGDFARVRWRLPSRRVGLERSPASAWQLSKGGRSTPLAGVGLPKQLGHARPRAHILAEASFPRRYQWCPTCERGERRLASERGKGAAARRCCRRPRRPCPRVLMRAGIGPRRRRSSACDRTPSSRQNAWGRRDA